MEFNFLDQPAVVQKKKKYATFTVKEIGGPEEIVKWREMQAAKESLYRMKLQTRENRIQDFEAELGQKIDAPTISSKSWIEKMHDAQEERERLAKSEEKVTAYPPWEPRPIEKRSLWGLFTGFIKRVWNDCNF